MNTKTMRLPPRRVLMPNKRKQRDDFDLKHLTPEAPISKSPKPAAPLAGSDKTGQPVSSNQLFAGYLAHEFLTCGTLLGQLWDPSRKKQKEEVSEAAESEPTAKFSAAAEAEVEADPKLKRKQRYVEVAYLLKGEGAHIPGIVNPSQLACLLQM